ncbi:MAG: type IV pilus secretin PilQ [Burkholderiaceae bacterium]|nr:type IV pilus secretin PilQ [Burkholderiaceae bacterium]
MVVAIPVRAEPGITGVSGTVQGGSEVVRVEFSEPLAAVPTGFVIQQPARIALDFPGVVNQMGKSTVVVNQGNVRMVNVVQATDRTRMVLNLTQTTTYQTNIRGNTLLILLDPINKTGVPVRTSVFAESRNVATAPLKNVDFRRGTDTSGRVVVSLPNDQVGVDIRPQGQDLVVEFLKTSLPEGLHRKLDVSDFGTPVQSVSTEQSGDRVKMTIVSKGAWEHSAYQNDSELVVEVRPQKVEDASGTTIGRSLTYQGEKLSLNFQNIEVRSLLQVIADFTSFNIVTSDSVQGNLTLRLKDVPWDQALDIILQAKSLGMKRIGNVLQIAPKDEMAAKEKAELEAQSAIESLESLRTQAFQLNYTKAKEIADQITGSTSSGAADTQNARILSRRGSVIAEPRTNQIFVTDIPSRIAHVQEMLSKLDVPVRQVLIEARIVEASDTFGKSLGVKLGGADLRGVRGGDAGYSVGGGNRVAIGSSYGAVAGTTGQGGSVDPTANFVNLPAAGQLGQAAASFAISLFSSAANRYLNLELSALEADGKGRIVSSPRVVTANQVKALIEQGTEFPYEESAVNGRSTISFRKANLKLEVTPQITPEGNIILDLDINKDSRGETTTAGVAINTKHIKTNVLVENGGTVVIGGIFELTETEDVTQVPLLGDIPILGNLFKSRGKTSNKQELLVFITPKVISDSGSGMVR